MRVRARLLVLFTSLVCVVAFPAAGVEYTFRRVAGTQGGGGAVDGNGPLARFNGPSGIVADDAGTIYVADRVNGTIRVIDPSGEVRTFAGLATGGCVNVEGARSDARLCGPFDVALDSHGNLFVAHSAPAQISKITPGGFVTAFAGGCFGYDDGIGAAACFTSATSLAIDANDNIYVADTGAHTIRKITPAAVVTTFAGTGGLSGSVDLTGAAARFNSPQGIAVASDGTVYVGDTGNHTIRRITPARAVTTLAGAPGQSGYLDAEDAAARFNMPMGLDVDPDGHVTVADWGNHVIRKVTAAGLVLTWAGVFGSECAGTDGSWSVASFCTPRDVFVNGPGMTYVAEDYGHTIREITPSLTVSTIAGLHMSTGSSNGSPDVAEFNHPYGVLQRGWNIYVVDKHAIRAVNLALGAVATMAGSPDLGGQVDGSGISARFAYPRGIAADSHGNLFVCDTDNHTIRKIDTSWNVTTFAGTADAPGAADGIAASARFNKPVWIAIDATDNMYVTEEANFTVRKITPGAVVTTLAGTAGQSGMVDATGPAARFTQPTGIGCDSDGNILVNDQSAVRRITPAGVVTTLAGAASSGIVDGTGTAARFEHLRGLAVAADDTIFVNDRHRIRRIASGAVVTTIGGHAYLEGTEEGTGNVSRFTSPEGIAVGPSAEILITHSARLVVGSPRIEDEATIDDPDGPLNVARTLDSVPTTASSWKWTIVRRPAGSTALLSDDTAPAPTFMPDVPDRFTFRLTATTDSGAGSITDVSLEPPCAVLSFGPPSLVAGVTGIPYNRWLTAANGTAPYAWELQIGTLPPGVTLTPSGQLIGTPTLAGTYEFDAIAEDRFGCRGDGSYKIVVTNGPANLVATGSASSVTVSWSDVAGAALYKIFRKSAGTGFVLIGTTIAPTTSDYDVQANKAYVYYVKASAGAAESGPSNRDLATTHVFTDEPLVPGTLIKLAHLNQLRGAVSSVRVLAGLSAVVIVQETIVRKTQLTSLRLSLDEARAGLGLPAIGWTEITAGVTKVQAAHFTQVRNAVK